MSPDDLVVTQTGMRRDYFTLEVDGVAGERAERPSLTITYEGPAEGLESRLTKGGAIREADEVDVAFRLRDRLGDDEPLGVLGLADRVTGEYVCEVDAPAEDVFAFVDAAREYGEGADVEDRYRIVVRSDARGLASYDKSTLLVYDAEGELLRGESLIPSGVEL